MTAASSASDLLCVGRSVYECMYVCVLRLDFGVCFFIFLLQMGVGGLVEELKGQRLNPQRGAAVDVVASKRHEFLSDSHPNDFVSPSLAISFLLANLIISI